MYPYDGLQALFRNSFSMTQGASVYLWFSIYVLQHLVPASCILDISLKYMVSFHHKKEVIRTHINPMLKRRKIWGKMEQISAQRTDCI